MLRGRIELPRLHSARLEGNLLGDPAERDVLVYLPPSYDRVPEARYPVVMVLPAYAATHRSLMSYRAWEPDFFERYERTLSAADAPEAILVAPDCMTRWGGSQYLDSSVSGAYQSYVVDDVLPFVDARYRTRAERASRAVVGHSSGGFGALRLALDRPEAFAFYASHAGDSAFEASIRPTFTGVAITLGRAGGLAAFLERFERDGPRSGGDFDAIMTIASAAAYSPAPEKPWPHLELPFDLATAEARDAIWERWCAHDPVRRLSAPSRIDEASFVYLDAGDRDEHGLQLGARQIASRLRERGVPHLFEEFEGGHRGNAHRFERSIPLLLGRMA
ncbi:MAG: alpha/beta hydrolase [Sandaracinaceae bacterium]